MHESEVYKSLLRKLMALYLDDRITIDEMGLFLNMTSEILVNGTLHPHTYVQVVKRG